MFAKKARSMNYSRGPGLRRNAAAVRPCNDNRPVRLIAPRRRKRRPLLFCRWQLTPAGQLECSWHDGSAPAAEGCPGHERRQSACGRRRIGNHARLRVRHRPARRATDDGPLGPAEVAGHGFTPFGGRDLYVVDFQRNHGSILLLSPVSRYSPFENTCSAAPSV